MKTEKRSRGKKIGMINPQILYNVHALENLGIGRALIAEGRKSGDIKTYTVGNAIWYRGDEIYQWIVSGKSINSQTRRGTQENENATTERN
jgi:hypothetical protein